MALKYSGSLSFILCPSAFDVIIVRLYITLPPDPKDANRIEKKSQWFTLYERILDKKAFAQPLLRCTTLDEGHKILEEIHEGECGAHIGGRTLVAKALRTGYYWPTLRSDAIEMVQKCDKFQRFTPIHHQPSTPLTAIHFPLCPSLLRAWIF